MTYEQDILNEESNIARLEGESKKIFVPRRDINFQFRNRGNMWNMTPRVKVARHTRRLIGRQITASKERIVSLKDALTIERNKLLEPSGEI